MDSALGSARVLVGFLLRDALAELTAVPGAAILKFSNGCCAANNEDVSSSKAELLLAGAAQLLAETTEGGWLLLLTGEIVGRVEEPAAGTGR